MSRDPDRGPSLIVAALGSLLALLGFGVPFWALLGQGTVSDARTALATTLGTAWVLGMVYAVHHVGQARQARVQARLAAAEQARAAAREAAAEAAHRVLLEDPRWTAFQPVIRRWRLSDEGWLLQQEARYRALLADPRRAHHAEKILDGARWSDVQLDYFDDPAARVTCVHLQPVEAGLREAGYLCWPQRPGALGTAATLRCDALRARYALAACVQWRWEEAHPHAPVQEFLHCAACGSEIESGNGALFPPG